MPDCCKNLHVGTFSGTHEDADETFSLVRSQVLDELFFDLALEEKNSIFSSSACTVKVCRKNRKKPLSVVTK